MNENDANAKPRCLVLGGRGFIGSHLVTRLLASGYRVRCLDRPNVTPIGETHLANPDFEMQEGDFLSEADIARAVAGCDIGFHLVSTTLPKSSNADPVFDVETNLVGSIRLLQHAHRANMKKIIFSSSGGTIYGHPEELPIPETHPTDPLCGYGITKLATEKYLRLFQELHGMDYRVLRLANPFGEGQRLLSSQGAIAVFLGKAMRGEAIEIWGDGSVTRDYIHIDDVVSAFLAAMHHTGAERVFNIGTGQGRSLNHVLDTIEKTLQRPTIRRYLATRPFDVPVNVLCVERARSSLGWTPRVPFEEGLARFAGWLAQDPEINARTGFPLSPP